MNYTEHWQLKSLKKQDYNQLEGVIIGTQWEVTLTDEDGYSAKFSGATPFRPNEVNPNTFTEYSELNEQTVLNWIKNTVSGSNMATNYWDHILGRIKKDIDGQRNVITNVAEHELPWYTGSLSGSVTPPLPGPATYQAQPE